MKRTKTVLTLLGLAVSFASMAQQEDSLKLQPAKSRWEAPSKAPIRKTYFGNSLDAAIFSTALIDNAGVSSLGTLRFTMFFHVGGTFNYNFNKVFGVYTGLDMKNIGFIEKFKVDNVTVKRRVYTLGIPLGLRIGNMKTRDYFFLGGGLDVPFHYKLKGWSRVQSKVKISEWFSDETARLMPYLFAGVSFRGSTLKVQYYPGNFLNEDYVSPGTSLKTYAGKNVNLLLFSLGHDMKFSRKR